MQWSEILQEGSVVVVLNATCSPIHRHKLRRLQKRNKKKNRMCGSGAGRGAGAERILCKHKRHRFMKDKSPRTVQNQ